MSRPRFSGAIFWGLVFMAIGVLFLARNLGYPISVWAGISRYWPVLLIVWGLFKIVDYLGMDPEAKNKTLFSGGDVFAIVLLILFGSLITVAANMSPDLGKLIQLGDLDVWDITGNNFMFTEQHSMDAVPDAKIEISNRFGDVEVMPSDTDRITVDVQKTIRAANQQEADTLASGFVYSISIEGSKFKIGTSFDRRFKASLTIHVPKRSSVSIENRNGDVAIHLVQPPTHDISVTNQFGEVTLELPANSSFQIDALNRHADVYSEFPGVSTSVKNAERTLSGQVGTGGPRIHIDSRSGEVRLVKKG